MAAAMHISDQGAEEGMGPSDGEGEEDQSSGSWGGGLV